MDPQVLACEIFLTDNARRIVVAIAIDLNPPAPVARETA